MIKKATEYIIATTNVFFIVVGTTNHSFNVFMDIITNNTPLTSFQMNKLTLMFFFLNNISSYDNNRLKN